MSFLKDRLLFLGFAGLSVAIVYNALYLQQEKRDAARQRGGGAEIALGEKGRAAPGSASEIMRAIQRELTTRGYDTGPADGLAGEKTRKAIAEYEKRNGLPPTGQPSMDLLRRIVLGESIAELAEPEPELAPVPEPEIREAEQVKAPIPPALKREAAIQAKDVPSKPVSDPVVEGVQRILADLGYAPGPVDGVMGETTKKAIEAFERDRNLPQKGDVTPALIKEIERVSGRALAGRG